MTRQYPLPEPGDVYINPKAALALPNGGIDDYFTITPLVRHYVPSNHADLPQLALPASFGSAFVGEAFSCTLTCHVELPPNSDHRITSVKISADIQTPSQTVPLDISPSGQEAEQLGLTPGQTLQKFVRYDLREEGSHVLAVSLTYSENIISQSEKHVASAGRVRSFRKLYQFQVLPLLTVRTKATDLPNGDRNTARYALEAQLENLADDLITLESLSFDPKAPFRSKSLNWDITPPGKQGLMSPMLAPREVTQVAFLIEERRKDGEEAAEKELTTDGRTILGVLTIRWRGAMGDPGILSTGWLTSKRK